MTNRRLACILAAVMLVPTITRGDQISEATADFVAQRYGLVFQRLFSYRLESEGTLGVDYMLAVSACKLNDPDFKTFGGALLAIIPTWYQPLPPDKFQIIRGHAQRCPSYGLTEEQAIARLKGKTDLLDHARLSSSRSSSGKDSPLPPAPMDGGRGDVGRGAGGRGAEVPPPPARAMGPLLPNQGFLGGTDYRQVQTSSAMACSNLCGTERACVAITYLVKEQTCYLKNALTTLVSTGNMISAVKK